MNKKGLSLLLAAGLLISASLFANGSSESGGVGDGRITVQSWQYALGDYKGFSKDDELTGAVAEDFNASHPGLQAEVKILRDADHYTSLRVDFAAGTAPDVIGIAPGANLDQFKDLLEPLRPYAEKEWGADWKNMFTEAAFTTIELSGDGIYAFPSAMSASGTVWYNRQLLGKAGVDGFPATWAELEETTAALRDAGHIPLMFGGKDAWQSYDMFITILGTINKDLANELFANEGDWTESDAVGAFAYFQALYTDGIVQDGALSTTLYNEGYSLWKDDDGNSSLPMIFNGSWDLGSLKASNNYYEKFSSYGIGVSTFPDIEGNEAVVLTAPDVAWAVNADSDDKEAAWDFVQWLCYDMQQQVVDGLGFFSVLKDAPSPTVTLTPDYSAAYATISSAVASDRTVGFRSSFYPDMNKALFENLQLLAISEITPEEAGAAMNEACATIGR